MTERRTDSVTPRRGAVVIPALVSGAGLAVSLPPWGWWVLAFPSAGLLWWRLGGLRPRTRLWAGWLAGLGLYVPGLLWARSFTLPGAVVLMVTEAAFMAVACLAVPAGPVVARVLAFPAALTLAEAARMRWPFGGLPIGGVFLGQAGGPVLGVARLAGPLGLTLAVYLGGAGLAALAEAVVVAERDGRRARAFARVDTAGGVERVAPRSAAVAGIGPLVRSGSLALAVLVAMGVLADHAPDGGGSVGAVSTAAVQGGGARGFRKSQIDPAVVLAAQESETRVLRQQDHGSVPSLVLWPEDVVSLGAPLAGTPEEAALADLARTLHATLVVGVTETLSTTTFRNEIVAWGPDGTLVARFEKVHRVPFGEYVPDRHFFAHLADLSAVPLDAVAGHGTGLLVTPAGPARGHGLLRGVLRRSGSVLGAQRGPAPHRPHQHLVLRHGPGARPGDRRLHRPGRPAGSGPPAGGPDRLQRRCDQSGHPAPAVGPRGTPDHRGNAVTTDRMDGLRPLRRRPAPGAGRARPPRRVGGGGTEAPAPGDGRATAGRRPGGTGLLVVARVDVHAGDPLGMEHGEVVGVVLEGQPQVEAVGAELVHRCPA